MPALMPAPLPCPLIPAVIPIVTPVAAQVGGGSVESKTSKPVSHQADAAARAEAWVRAQAAEGAGKHATPIEMLLNM